MDMKNLLNMGRLSDPAKLVIRLERGKPRGGGGGRGLSDLDSDVIANILMLDLLETLDTDCAVVGRRRC